MEKIKSGHQVEIRICPGCNNGYCSQHGGQKSGVYSDKRPRDTIK